MVVGTGCRHCFVADGAAAADVVAADAAVSGCRCRPRMRFWRYPYSIDLLNLMNIMFMLIGYEIIAESADVEEFEQIH